MPGEMWVVCFTDLAGSTAVTEHLGHDMYLPHASEHIRVAEELAAMSEGEYLKSIGDANMVMFRAVTDAVDFATRLQEYYRETPSLDRRISTSVKIGLALGLVEPTRDKPGFGATPLTAVDAFGSGANEAARVQHEAPEDWVLINDRLAEALRTQWGPEVAQSVLESVGTFELKGFEKDRELFALDWEGYSARRPTSGLSGAVMSALQSAGIVLHERLEGGALAAGGRLVWPVVPRRRVTAIHRAQAEVIRLLALLGWTAQLLIADCQSPGRDDPQTDPARFCRDLLRYCSSRGLKLDEPVYLSNLWRPVHDDYDSLQEYFRLMTCDMTLEDVRRMNTKGYGDQDRLEIDNRPTLDNLRPALSAAAVLTMAPGGSTCIVVAGFDEQFQWRKTTAVADRGQNVCTVLIPELMVDREHQLRQRGMFPWWESQEELAQQMERDAQSNLPSWVFHMHCFLPRFPVVAVEFENGERVKPSDWGIAAADVPANFTFTKRDVARVSWPILGPIPRA